MKTEEVPLFSNLLPKNPIRNEPRKFIKSVPIGKLGKYNL